MVSIASLRENLKATATREPGARQPLIRVLDTQLRNFAKGNTEDKAALRPMIEKSIRKIKAVADGRSVDANSLAIRTT